MEHEYKVVKLHDYPDLIEQAAYLLNSEWPRSLTARCHFLKESSDDLPCSFLLLQLSGGSLLKVVGYSHLCKVLQKPKSVLIESVIVDKALRGCGLGRMVMERTEDFAQKLGYENSHLSTHDKCLFYEHLGYKNSFPVSPERKVAKFLSNEQIENLDKHFHHTNSTSLYGLTDDTASQGNVVKVSQDQVTSLLQPVVHESPVPPPPPLPPSLPFLPTPPRQGQAVQGVLIGRNKHGKEEDKKMIWMKKVL